MGEVAQTTDKTSSAFDKHGKKIETTSGRIVRSAEVNRDAWDKAGRSLTAFGAVGVAALGFAAKAAVDWEDAWTGVLKTVDGSAEQYAALEESSLSAGADVRPRSARP